MRRNKIILIMKKRIIQTKLEKIKEILSHVYVRRILYIIILAKTILSFGNFVFLLANSSKEKISKIYAFGKVLTSLGALYVGYLAKISEKGGFSSNFTPWCTLFISGYLYCGGDNFTSICFFFNCIIIKKNSSKKGKKD